MEMTQQVYMDSQLSERSTQTSRTGTVVDASVATQSYSTSVSVNIGTDEDDISVFLGSLFCDASVETTFPSVQLVHGEFTLTVDFRPTFSLHCTHSLFPITGDCIDIFIVYV